MGAKTELKLLARQQSDQNWKALPGDELIATDAASDYGAGVLVLVELGKNNQIQGVQDATRQLINILMNFSKMKEKFGAQEEEIEGWKQSLIYQSQELTRREVDIESRAEELEQWESESQKIQEQRREFEETKAQILELKDKIESDRQQLEEGWGKLHQAQRELEDLQATHSGALSDTQVQQIEVLLAQLESSVDPSGDVQQILQEVEHQLHLAQKSLEEDRVRLAQLQQQVQAQESLTQQTHQSWEYAQSSLAEAVVDCLQCQSQLDLQRELQHLLREQSMFYASLEENLQGIQSTLNEKQPVDVRALWTMSVEDLNEKTHQLSSELEKLKAFVADQEEELLLQQGTIDEMRAKLDQASEYDRLTQQSELEEEEQHYRLLNETLEGQRLSLQDRVHILEVHEDILSQRQTLNGSGSAPEVIDLAPSLDLIEGYRSADGEKLDQIDANIEHLQKALDSAQDRKIQLEGKAQELWRNLEEQGQLLRQAQQDLGLCQGKIEAYQTSLQPLETALSNLKSNLGNLAGSHEIVTHLKETLMQLGEAPEVASY
ncbi:pilus motility taxis protein HmpF [Lyngbya confervoides BDU141951]|uniref:Pilus motility taxis protein HmpF n=2 Tax=Lyngbya TaxID=28073 RepID=A0ABD4T8U8_9CYAN|nr:pilus motility taxis protein HmpF [Lyngbya confervoides BDU141951]